MIDVNMIVALILQKPVRAYNSTSMVTVSFNISYEKKNDIQPFFVKKKIWDSHIRLLH